MTYYLGGQDTNLSNYLKNFMGWELVREDVNGLNWTEIIPYPCPVSSLSEVLLRVIGMEFPSGRLWSERVISLGLMTGVSLLAHRAKQRAYIVWSCSRTQADYEEYT